MYPRNMVSFRHITQTARGKVTNSNSNNSNINNNNNNTCKARYQVTTAKSHVGHCTHNLESTNVNEQNVQNWKLHYITLHVPKIV